MPASKSPVADRPSIEEFIPNELGQKSWGTELLIAKTESYIGKVLWMRAGHGGPLQYHEQKDETFYLHRGKAIVDYVEDGDLKSVDMVPGQSFHVPPGAPHRVTALEDSVFFEASTPHFEDRQPWTRDD